MSETQENMKTTETESVSIDDVKESAENTEKHQMPDEKEFAELNEKLSELTDKYLRIEIGRAHV